MSSRTTRGDPNAGLGAVSTVPQQVLPITPCPRRSSPEPTAVRSGRRRAACRAQPGSPRQARCRLAGPSRPHDPVDEPGPQGVVRLGCNRFGASVFPPPAGLAASSSTRAGGDDPVRATSPSACGPPQSALAVFASRASCPFSRSTRRDLLAASRHRLVTIPAPCRDGPGAGLIRFAPPR